MAQPIVQVDAFTATAFAGNPAAVCVLPEARDAAWMQLVAREMNLSETAFVLRLEDGFSLRWFTPRVEVDLCGHATLASAHTLWESGLLPVSEPARFHTRSGLLTARKDGAWIELDFPSEPATPVEPPPGLLEALGVLPVLVGRNRFDYLVEVDDEDAVRATAPDFGALEKIEARGVIVTARSSSPDFSFVSRFFAPAVGVDEDPVTGSAHCCLGPLWAARLGTPTLTAYQASARGGAVRVTVAGDRVLLGGQAITVMHGELLA